MGDSPPLWSSSASTCVSSSLHSRHASGHASCTVYLISSEKRREARHHGLLFLAPSWI